MTNSADIPHSGSAWALFGLAEREQNPFGPCGYTAHVSLLLGCSHTKTHTHWHDIYKWVLMPTHTHSNPKTLTRAQECTAVSKFTQMPIDKHTHPHTHSHWHTQHWPVIWPYTGMVATHCLSWELTSWHSVLGLCVLCSPARSQQERRGWWREWRIGRERWRNTDKKQRQSENGEDGGREGGREGVRVGVWRGGRAGIWQKESRDRGRDRWKNGGTQGRRQRGWSVLSQCLGLSHLAPASSPHKAPVPRLQNTWESPTRSKLRGDGWTVTAVCRTVCAFNCLQQLKWIHTVFIINMESSFHRWTLTADMKHIMGCHLFCVQSELAKAQDNAI